MKNLAVIILASICLLSGFVHGQGGRPGGGGDFLGPGRGRRPHRAFRGPRFQRRPNLDGLCIRPLRLCSNQQDRVPECVDFQVDPDNSGGCEETCDPSSICVNGECACEEGYVECDGECVESDDYNCGKCGRECKDTSHCVNKECKCGTHELYCDHECIPETTDHCGKCSKQCDENFDCVNHACICAHPPCSCPANHQLCDGECVEKRNRAPWYPCGCSFCDSRKSEICCDDRPVVAGEDNKNCGTCGRTCPANSYCSDHIVCLCAEKDTSDNFYGICDIGGGVNQCVPVINHEACGCVPYTVACNFDEICDFNALGDAECKKCLDGKQECGNECVSIGKKRDSDGRAC